VEAAQLVTPEGLDLIDLDKLARKLSHTTESAARNAAMRDMRDAGTN
jgi:hypothetical protein